MNDNYLSHQRPRKGSTGNLALHNNGQKKSVMLHDFCNRDYWYVQCTYTCMQQKFCSSINEHTWEIQIAMLDETEQAVDLVL